MARPGQRLLPAKRTTPRIVNTAMLTKDRAVVNCRGSPTVPRPSPWPTWCGARRAVANCLGSPSVPTRLLRPGTPSSSTPATLTAFLVVLEAVSLWPCNAHKTCVALQPAWPSPPLPWLRGGSKPTRWGQPWAQRNAPLCVILFIFVCSKNLACLYRGGVYWCIFSGFELYIF